MRKRTKSQRTHRSTQTNTRTCARVGFVNRETRHTCANEIENTDALVFEQGAVVKHHEPSTNVNGFDFLSCVPANFKNGLIMGKQSKHKRDRNEKQQTTAQPARTETDQNDCERSLGRVFVDERQLVSETKRQPRPNQLVCLVTRQLLVVFAGVDDMRCHDTANREGLLLRAAHLHRNNAVRNNPTATRQQQPQQHKTETHANRPMSCRLRRSSRNRALSNPFEILHSHKRKGLWNKSR